MYIQHQEGLSIYIKDNNTVHTGHPLPLLHFSVLGGTCIYINTCNFDHVMSDHGWWGMWLFVKQLFLICPLKRRKNCWPNIKPHILDDDWCTVSFSWSNRLCSLSTLWVWLKVCSFLADNGSLQCMINSRFGRNCTFKIPEYNIFYIVYYKNRTAFKMKRYL